MRQRFDVLDSFRGIAALMVAIYHLHVNGYVSQLNIIRNSYLFVDFFFVLSGFVISFSYLGKIDNFSSLMLFIKRRFARLWPLHVFVLFLFIPFAIADLYFGVVVGDRFMLSAFFTNIFMLQGFGIHDDITWNSPAWSIGVEFYIYIVFAILCLSNFARPRFFILFSLLSLFLLYKYSSMDEVLRFAIFRCAYSFFLGVVAFKISLTLNVRRWMEPICLGSILFLMICFRMKGTDLLSFCMPLLFCLTIVVFSQQTGIISNFLSTALFIRVGMLSYSIYMVHFLVIGSIKSISIFSDMIFDVGFFDTINSNRVIDFGIGWLNDFIYIPYIAIILILSKFTYHNIEKVYQDKINNSKFFSL